MYETQHSRVSLNFKDCPSATESPSLRSRAGINNWSSPDCDLESWDSRVQSLITGLPVSLRGTHSLLALSSCMLCKVTQMFSASGLT